MCWKHFQVLDELDVCTIMKKYAAGSSETTILLPNCGNQKLQLLGLIHRWHGSAHDGTEQLSCISQSFCNLWRPVN